MKYLPLFPLFLFSLCHAESSPPGIPNLAADSLPEFARTHDTDLAPDTHDNRSALRILFGSQAPWPNVAFEAVPAPWDWQAFAGIRIGLYNPEAEPVTVNLRVDNEGANGAEHCNTTQKRVAPGTATDLILYFNTKDRERFWGMRGIPVRGPMGTGAPLDLSQITGWQLFLNRPEHPRPVLVTAVSLFGQGGDLAEKVPFPFIDAYGQYKYLDWPGKVHRDEDLRDTAPGSSEGQTVGAPVDLDAYGGWAAGPTLEATGWFRTEQVDGQWWLVTPDGHLFFSAGADCVGAWQHSFVTGRKAWFEWLPDESDERFKPAYGYARNAHSMAETIGGEGQTFSFYTANLIRAFGPDWQGPWRDRTLARLRAWGFNTIGNWSQWDVMREGGLPFVASFGIQGVRPIEAASGYWAKMMDVYDPGFAPAVDKAVQHGTEPWRDNNRCIGYFSDNELAWEGVADGVLRSGPEQSARQALLAFLQQRHATLADLNTAWNTAYAGWADIGPPATRGTALQADLDGFLYAFAEVYFRTVRDAIARHAPHQLYLGARFAGAPDPVVRACAARANVVSFNVYARGLGADRAALFAGLGTPVLIGEFHFGATDRGMFHPGLVPADNQAERGHAYAQYVEELLRRPAVVGCHWFQYVDEPVTGRYFDGENYNIGFVDVTDRPYAPLSESAGKVHGRMYEIRRSARETAGR